MNAAPRGNCASKRSPERRRTLGKGRTLMAGSTSKRRIDVFALGGTISATSNELENPVKPTLSGKRLLADLPFHVNADLVVHEHSPVPSNWLTIEDAVELAREIEHVAHEGSTGIVVVQGTDSLEEMGFILEIACRSHIPIALTGAMRSPSAASPDGAANIHAALTYVLNTEAPATVVVMNDEVHPARHVVKAHTTRPDAFTSAPFGPEGIVAEDQFLPYRTPLVRPNCFDELKLSGDIASVLMITATLGERLEWLPKVAEEYSGLVIQGMGSGHVGQRAARVVAGLAEEMPVVVCSRAARGPILRNTYGYVGSEIYFREAGAHLSRLLDGLRSRLLLSLVCGQNSNRSAAIELYRHIEDSLIIGQCHDSTLHIGDRDANF